jgi:hypothetical protein
LRVPGTFRSIVDDMEFLLLGSASFDDWRHGGRRILSGQPVAYLSGVQKVTSIRVNDEA